MFLIVIIWEMEKTFNKIMTQKTNFEGFLKILDPSLTFRLRKTNKVRFSIARWV